VENAALAGPTHHRLGWRRDRAQPAKDQRPAPHRRGLRRRARLLLRLHPAARRPLLERPGRSERRTAKADPSRRVGPVSGPPPARGRARDFGIPVGFLPTGTHNAITDVAGVRVGHQTVWKGDYSPSSSRSFPPPLAGEGQGGGSEPVIRSGVTAIWPHTGDLFRERLYAAISVFNGYGEMTGRSVIDEWGLLGSPIVLTDTVHIGLAYDSVVRYMTNRDPEIADKDVVIPVVAETDDSFLSDNRAFGITREDVYAALDAAKDGPVAEGCVGAGTGTQQFDFKGGIGTGSRVVELSGERFTVGVLLQTKSGCRHQLLIAGV